ncbi:MAG: hypothetical protein HUU08_05380 [Candidatus Brocadia sp.]|nr:hypothetical protein [Candidatus Brocadia sp.]
MGEFTSIKVDSSGKAHISYYDCTNSALKYATNASGSWETRTLDSSGNIGGYAAIAVDTSDKTHISYYDDTHFNLKYATNAD